MIPSTYERTACSDQANESSLPAAADQFNNFFIPAG